MENYNLNNNKSAKPPSDKKKEFDSKKEEFKVRCAEIFRKVIRQIIKFGLEDGCWSEDRYLEILLSKDCFFLPEEILDKLSFLLRESPKLSKNFAKGFRDFVQKYNPQNVRLLGKLEPFVFGSYVFILHPFPPDSQPGLFDFLVNSIVNFSKSKNFCESIGDFYGYSTIKLERVSFYYKKDNVARKKLSLKMLVALLRALRAEEPNPFSSPSNFIGAGYRSIFLVPDSSELSSEEDYQPDSVGVGLLDADLYDGADQYEDQGNNSDTNKDNSNFVTPENILKFDIIYQILTVLSQFVFERFIEEISEELIALIADPSRENFKKALLRIKERMLDSHQEIQQSVIYQAEQKISELTSQEYGLAALFSLYPEEIYSILKLVYEHVVCTIVDYALDLAKKGLDPHLIPYYLVLYQVKFSNNTLLYLKQEAEKRIQSF